MAQEPLNDPDLIRRAQAGDAHAIETLAAHCSACCYTLLMFLTGDHHLSEDLAQEACINFLRSLKTVDPSQGARNWVATIASNVRISESRKKRPTSLDTSAGSAAAFNLPSREPDPSEQPDDDEIGGTLGQALQQLTPLRRTILILRFCLGLSAEETAERLGITVQKVYTETHRALEQLRAALGQNAPKPFGEPDK